MDLDVTPPKAEALHLLPYSELRKVAAKHGIKRKCKSEKLIELILSRTTDDEEVFSTPAAKELNSSRKQKEKALDENQKTPLETPRRGTYSLESASVKAEEGADDDLDTSNVTMSRGSERKLRPRKVSFVSPVVTPRATPRSQRVRSRPKTPVAPRTPLDDTIDVAFSFTTPPVVLSRAEEDSMPVPTIVVIPSTPSPAKGVEISGQPGLALKAVEASSDHPKPPATVTTSTKKTPGSSRSFHKEPTSCKRGMTPNFRRIHQRAFDKMESIDDYHQRRLLNSAKKLGRPPFQDIKPTTTRAATKTKKVAGCSGIPFIPSVKHSSIAHKIKDAPKENKAPLPAAKNKAALTPALSTRGRLSGGKKTSSSAVKKFDLQASLSRKLGYKPYTGALKPLGQAPRPTQGTAAKEQAPVNKVVRQNRTQTRSIIKGVRINKRFALQMQNRKVDCSL